MAIPTLILALVVLAMLPKTMPMIIAVLGILESTRVLRVARSLALDIAAQEFIEVARLRGERLSWVLWREILPNAYTTLVAEFALRFIFILLVSCRRYRSSGWAFSRLLPTGEDWRVITKTAFCLAYGPL